MLVKPEDVKFESQGDLIDYVSVGFPPRKKDYKKVIDAMYANQPNEDVEDGDGEQVVKPEPGTVYVPNYIYRDMNRYELEQVLDRVYQNNCKNRNRLLIGIGIGLAAVVGIAFACGDSKEDKKDGKSGEDE